MEVEAGVEEKARSDSVAFAETAGTAAGADEHTKKKEEEAEVERQTA